MTTPQHTDPALEIPDFGDGKDAGALRTIGEVASALNIKQHVLRYWEEQFPTLRPLTRAGGRRYYRPDDVVLIMRINRLLHHEGYTIKGAKQALDGKSAATPQVRGGKQGAAAEVISATAGIAAASTEFDANNAATAHPLIEFLQSIRNNLAAALED